MPEIGEVANLVHRLRMHLVGKTISSVQAIEDMVVFKDTTSELFKKAITGKKVVDAGQQGKYFWIAMSSPPHVVAHLGMTGDMTFSNQSSSWYKPKKEGSEWPPKYWKFLLSITEDPECEVAFTDVRRLARIRLVDCEANHIRKHSPLKENGPDPVIDKEKLSKAWFVEKIQKKRVPVKAWLLDQSNISGVGNWVGDEILYNAKIHPEQYTNSLSDAQLNRLLESILGVCSVAVETLADQERFPEEWLMRHRWSKGKKDKNKLPNGQKIEFVKVGGRTSAFVPTVQKITGSAADEETDSTKGAVEMDDRDSPSSDQDIKKKSKPPKKRAPKRKSDGVEDDDKEGSEEEEELAKPLSKKSKTSTVDKRSKGSSEKKPSAKSSSAADDNQRTRKRSTNLGKWLNGGN